MLPNNRIFACSLLTSQLGRRQTGVLTIQGRRRYVPELKLDGQFACSSCVRLRSIRLNPFHLLHSPVQLGQRSSIISSTGFWLGHRAKNPGSVNLCGTIWLGHRSKLSAVVYPHNRKSRAIWKHIMTWIYLPIIYRGELCSMSSRRTSPRRGYARLRLAGGPEEP